MISFHRILNKELKKVPSLVEVIVMRIVNQPVDRNSDSNFHWLGTISPRKFRLNTYVLKKLQIVIKRINMNYESNHKVYD